MTTSGKSLAWKHTTSLVIRAGLQLLRGATGSLRQRAQYEPAERHEQHGDHETDLLLSAAYSLQHADSSSGLPLEPLADVVGVGSRPVLKQHLPGLAGSGQILQVLYLIGGPTV